MAAHDGDLRAERLTRALETPRTVPQRIDVLSGAGPSLLLCPGKGRAFPEASGPASNQKWDGRWRVR